MLLSCRRTATVLKLLCEYVARIQLRSIRAMLRLMADSGRSETQEIFKPDISAGWLKTTLCCRSVLGAGRLLA